MIDLVLGIIALSSLAMGWIRGLTPAVGTLIGFVLGLLAGRGALFALEHLTAGSSQLTMSPTIGFAVPMGLGVVVSIIGGAWGQLLRERMRSRLGRTLDALGGSVSGLLVFCLVVWLLAGWVRTTALVEPNAWAAESRIVRALDATAPVPSSQALGVLGQALRFNGFPDVFGGEAEQIRDVGTPNPAVVSVGKDAVGSVVKIVTESQRCGSASEGSGWVYSPGLVATNAHVVAAAQNVRVQVGGRGRPYAADVIAFNPASDVAVLRVNGLDAPALTVGGTLRPGADAVVVGFPENGPYTISPARVRESLTAQGHDIYGSKTAVRRIYSLRADVRHGNSGGPLIDSQGRVAGMVFAKSDRDRATGYALTLKEMRPTLTGVKGATRAVSTGPCTGSP